MNGEMTSLKNTVEHTIKDFSSITPFVEKLKILSNGIEQNSYLKYSSNKLKQLIEDAESPLMVIFLGKERVGKTSLINAIIGRNLLPVGNKNPTFVNTFVRYGEKECIKAKFYDGTFAYFELKHLHLFTNSDSFLAEIIRENLMNIEVYVSCDLLKNCILIDTVALETNRDGKAYFSKSLLRRVDEIFWILRNDSMAIDSEIAFLKKMNQKGMKPYFIINKEEYEADALSKIISKEKERYGDFVEEFLGVSALQAIEAKKTHNMQLLIDSHLNDLISKINELSVNSSKRSRKIAIQFIYWLKQFETEVSLIPQREPYLSALKSVEKYHKQLSIDHRTEEDLKMLAKYDKEYEHVSEVLKEIQTLYQLLQTIEYEPYLKDDKVNTFVELALNYHEKVREYRKLYSEYIMEYNYFEMQQKKFMKKSIVALFTDKDKIQKELLINKAEKLNELQAKCEVVYKDIRKFELELMNDLNDIQRHINELAENRLKRILNKVEHLNVERKSERVTIQRYVDKLNEFQCIVDVQDILREEIKPFIENGELPYTPDELQTVLISIENILRIKLIEDTIISNVESELNEEIAKIKADFEEKYPFHPLDLTENDIISEIPTLPEMIDIESLKRNE